MAAFFVYCNAVLSVMGFKGKGTLSSSPNAHAMVKGKQDMVSWLCRADMLKHVPQLNAQVILGFNTKPPVEPVPVKNINFSWLYGI